MQWAGLEGVSGWRAGDHFPQALLPAVGLGWDRAPETFPKSSSPRSLGLGMEGGWQSLVPKAQSGRAKKPRQAGVRTPSRSKKAGGGRADWRPLEHRPGGRGCNGCVVPGQQVLFGTRYLY